MARREKYDQDVWALLDELDTVARKLRKAADEAVARGERGLFDQEKKDGEDATKSTTDDSVDRGSNGSSEGPPERV